MADDLARGISLIRNNGCLNCHSTDGTLKIGPTFHELWGRQESVITNGQTRTVVVDEAFLATALRDPDADIPAGYNRGTMPKVAASDEDVHAIALVLQSPKALSDAENVRARTIWSIAIAGAIFAVLFIAFTVIRARRENAGSGTNPKADPKSKPPSVP